MIFKQVRMQLPGYQAAMISEQRLHYVVVLACLLLSSSTTLLYAQPFYNSTVKLPNTWVNQPSLYTNNSGDPFELFVTPILLRDNLDGTAFLCGFSCSITGDSYIASESRDCLFGVHIFLMNRSEIFQYSIIQSPNLVWSANRNDPVQANATLELSEDGDLMLRDWDGRLAWSSNTGGKSVAGMNLTEEGNLVLFARNNEPIWQSFDYPTDSLLLGQALRTGQPLIASVSASSRSEGLFYLSVNSARLAAYVNSNPPQMYFLSVNNNNASFAEFVNGSFYVGPGYGNTSVARFIRLGPDGHLRAFQVGGYDWEEVSDLLGLRTCDYPMACGTYGVCSGSGQCSCPETIAAGSVSFFNENHSRQPSLGCSLVRPISCSRTEDHTLLELNDMYYFAFNARKFKEVTLLNDCKTSCLRNCSCKAALFVKASLSRGSCLMINEVFSMGNNEDSALISLNSTLYFKVQGPYSNASMLVQHSRSNTSRRRIVILASSFSAIFGVISVVGVCLVLFSKLNKQRDEARGDFLENVPGMPTRFSYAELKSATGDFIEKLGEGGFGSVYEGALSNGIKIAVKCLDGLDKVKESFLVEVKAMGSIQHVNLVKLMGFCFEKSHRLLVFEYMANRSLDGWIFDVQDSCHSLPWDTRKKIISDIAKGLTYLHEDCCQKIIHLDIKPQNILLDHSFNAKIGDFGLSKLIEKDQSRVITRMRGTPGYLAPEWLSSIITEKVDVYSFGIVMLEIICGRRNLDWSRAEEDKHLLRVFKRKAEEEKLEELVDEKSVDIVNHIEEVVRMMGVAAWCLQGDFTKRPSMSVVVKVLEGLVEAETNLDYDFLNPTVATKSIAYDATTELPPSALSGPR